MVIFSGIGQRNFFLSRELTDNPGGVLFLELGQCGEDKAEGGYNNKQAGYNSYTLNRWIYVQMYKDGYIDKGYIIYIYEQIER